jgi:hypothetical protein
MIDVAKLTPEDRGRIVKVTDDEVGSTQKAVLVNWNETYLFLAWSNIAPPTGGPCDPWLCTLTDERAELGLTRDGDRIWRHGEDEPDFSNMPIEEVHARLRAEGIDPDELAGQVREKLAEIHARLDAQKETNADAQ